MKTIQKIVLLVLLALLVNGAFAQSGIKIIVNNDNNIASISSDQLSRYFLKKSKKWDDGQTVKPVDLDANNKVRSKFTDKVHGKSISAIKAYWQKKIFTGKGVPPVEKSSEKAVIDYVKTNPGAIGYVSSNANVSGVKVIEVVN